jgi:di/tricarboxylate transporter
MFGASASFATPISHQTNTLVCGAGDHRFTDSLKIGITLNLVVGAVTCAAIYLLYPA